MRADFNPPKSLEQSDEDELNANIKTKLNALGISQFSVFKLDNLCSYFTCTSEESLRQLHTMFEYGVIKAELEKILSLTYADTICINRLYWNSADYSNSLQNIKKLNSTGQ